MIGPSHTDTLTRETAIDVQLGLELKVRKPEEAFEPLPVLRPKLPSAADILPYLQAIDSGRWYSNYGPLVQRLEKELSLHLGCRDKELVSVSNATAGITATLLALGLNEGSICIMPSWTFAATPHAAKAAGLTPWFHDIDPKTWELNPDQVKQTVMKCCVSAAAVVVVSPFGAPIDLRGWQKFREETGINVVVDAAAGFDTVTSSKLLSVVSLHATKIFAAGEGGFVLTDNSAMGDRVRACCNFGFHESRIAQYHGINAKMSEYHAAVALASLQRWPTTRLKHLKIMEWYRQAIAQVDSVSLHPGYGEGWATGTTSVILPAGSAQEVASLLHSQGIETRSWWGQGCHVQMAFTGCPRGELPVTDDLGKRVLGLPHFPDMERDDVSRVVTSLAHTLRNVAKRRRAS